MARLTCGQKECVILYSTGGLTQAEIAGRLGVSQVAVHKRLKRAECVLKGLAPQRQVFSMDPVALDGIDPRRIRAVV